MDEQTEWSRPFTALQINAYRTGWRGVWDAIKAAWTGDDRLQVVEDVTFSVYVKAPADHCHIWGRQISVDPD